MSGFCVPALCRCLWVLVVAVGDPVKKGGTVDIFFAASDPVFEN